LFLVALVFMALAAAFWKGGWQLTILGLTQASQLIQTVWLRLLLGFTLGGLIQVLLPRDLIAEWYIIALFIPLLVGLAGAVVYQLLNPA
jgi:uncharacterized membrane protein YraQ (UPF0718 family)